MKTNEEIAGECVDEIITGHAQGKDQMNAIELFHNDGKPAGVWYCGKCRQVNVNQKLADRCCTWPCNICQKQCRPGYAICEDCRRAKTEAREKERFDKAEKIEEWDGWVYSEGHGSNEGYFNSLEEFYDCLEDGNGDDPDFEPPDYVWACKSHPFPGIDISSAIENACDDMFEDASDHLEGMDELNHAVKAFNDLNKKLLSYSPDYTKAVIIELPK